MKKKCLSISHMLYLHQLGLDIRKASMCWNTFNNDVVLSIHDESCYECSRLRPIPAFTLHDILELLPKQLCLEDLNICNNGRYWRVYYHGIYSVENEDLLEALYEMLCCLVENGDVK